MRRVHLIHWNVAEADERAARLRAAGHNVTCDALDGAAGPRGLRDDPPVAVVIDLSRLPSHGRDVALAIRTYKATRHVPLVFVGGEAEKVAKVKDLLPDAVYTTWGRVHGALTWAIDHPPTDPVVPRSLLDGYSGTPLPKKLGIRANSVVVLVGAPEGFEATLGELPEGVVLRRQARGRCDMALWFAMSRKDLGRHIDRMGAFVGEGGLWIAWPKKSSGVTTDLSQGTVREIGLAAGLVDYKVCAIDATWTGLRFTRRKAE